MIFILLLHFSYWLYTTFLRLELWFFIHLEFLSLNQDSIFLRKWSGGPNEKKLCGFLDFRRLPEVRDLTAQLSIYHQRVLKVLESGNPTELKEYPLLAPGSFSTSPVIRFNFQSYPAEALQNVQLLSCGALLLSSVASTEVSLTL